MSSHLAGAIWSPESHVQFSHHANKSRSALQGKKAPLLLAWGWINYRLFLWYKCFSFAWPIFFFSLSHLQFVWNESPDCSDRVPEKDFGRLKISIWISEGSDVTQASFQVLLRRRYHHTLYCKCCTSSQVLPQIKRGRTAKHSQEELACEDRINPIAAGWHMRSAKQSTMSWPSGDTASEINREKRASVWPSTVLVQEPFSHKVFHFSL